MVHPSSTKQTECTQHTINSGQKAHSLHLQSTRFLHLQNNSMPCIQIAITIIRLTCRISIDNQLSVQNRMHVAPVNKCPAT